MPDNTDRGPVMVAIEYDIDPQNALSFLKAIRESAGDTQVTTRKQS